MYAFHFQNLVIQILKSSQGLETNPSKLITKTSEQRHSRRSDILLSTLNRFQKLF